MSERVDIVVVGSGAGGAPVAYKLAKAGAKVLVLEKGPRYRLEDFVHDEVAICRRDFWIPWVEEEPHTLRRNPKVRARPTREGWTSRCVGGATVHMSGFFYRAQPSDMNLATRLSGLEGASLADWPIALDELIPYYDEMEALIGVSGRAGTNPFERRSRAFPMPPLLAHPAAPLIDEAAARLGYHTFPTPRAVTSVVYGDRPPCTLCGFCGDYGCENRSKSSTLATFVPMAESTGRCEVRAESMVTRIMVDKEDRARGVVYRDKEGAEQKVEARVVVLAASAVESARLLLLSKSARFPNGLANNGGLVGRNLTFSTFSKATAIYERQALVSRVGEEGMSRAFLQRSMQDDYWNESLPGLPKGGTANFIRAHPNPINAVTRLVALEGFALWGESLKERAKAYFHDEIWLEAEIFGEYLPTPGTLVDLDPRVMDKWGFPVARITESRHPATMEMSKVLAERAQSVLDEVEVSPTHSFISAHSGATLHLQHGTCRFGVRDDQSVLDPSCRAHEVEGLYVSDGSFMPSSLGVPATATILANALRVGDVIRRRLSAKEL